MLIPTQSKAWVLHNKPDKDIDFSSGPNATFAFKTLDIPQILPEDSVLVKTIFLSNDPAQRGWIQKDMPPERLYVPPVGQGEVMRARGVARVLKVGGTSDTIKEGSLVAASPGWTDYAVVKKSSCTPIQEIPGLSPSVYVGAFGGPGLTAYWGLVDILKFKPGQNLLVSGAAGAVGNVVVQLARNVFGANKIVAIVGSKEKADYISKLGADVAVNYKDPNYKQAIKDACPEGFDGFFDNVGGEILDFSLTVMKRYGRIAACGAISTYNNPKSTKLENYFEVISSRLVIEGFIILDYLDRIGESIEALKKAYMEKKLVIEGGETVVKASSVEDIPKIWYGLFEGTNQGKLVTELP